MNENLKIILLSVISFIIANYIINKFIFPIDQKTGNGFNTFINALDTDQGELFIAAPSTRHFVATPEFERFLDTLTDKETQIMTETIKSLS